MFFEGAKGFKSLLLRSVFLRKNPYKLAVLGFFFFALNSRKLRYCGVLTSSEPVFSRISSDSLYREALKILKKFVQKDSSHEESVASNVKIRI